MFGGGLARGLVKKAVAASVVAGAALVAVMALGATIFFALLLVLVPLAAAATTFLLFAIVAIVVALVLVNRSETEEDFEDEPSGLGARAYSLFRQRPILGTVAALAGGWIFLRNPALATMVAAAFTEKPHRSRRR
ncbi:MULTISPECIES: hypothetical protein [unclassified Brevundimonas]|uniref:hypothetical protein n=1 Tax=unclassified Brevundimonas TaxID=2622653 RepID=UPI0006FF2712|nr:MULTISPECIES: hypothetical protein [unclassified Brevundimonas]KQY90839.1 hypothetical protein ASD25_20180 [Brevundimonas sp. Root1423]KRA28453.1 hypothetical protein ASD59_01085 [Brevundimonas sp. Root608]